MTGPGRKRVRCCIIAKTLRRVNVSRFVRQLIEKNARWALYPIFVPEGVERVSVAVRQTIEN